MDNALQIAAEMHQALWDRFQRSVDDLAEDEIDWRFLPQANSINVIVRHLRIESEWHLRSLQSGEPMPTIAAPVSQVKRSMLSRSISWTISMRSSGSTLTFPRFFARNR